MSSLAWRNAEGATGESSVPFFPTLPFRSILLNQREMAPDVFPASVVRFSPKRGGMMWPEFLMIGWGEEMRPALLRHRTARAVPLS
jgi:hypothetical protein